MRFNLLTRRPILSRWLPTPGNILFTLLVAAALLWGGSAGAFPLPGPRTPTSSTTTMSYQGRLADSNGSPLTLAGVAMVFNLYNVSTGGSSLWTESQNVPVSNGLFSVILGNTTAIPVSVVTGNATLWLGITVGNDSEMTPRQPITGAPYAIRAQTVPDGAITTLKLADGAVTQAKAPSLVLGPDANTRVAHGMATATRMTSGNTLAGFVDISLASYGFTQTPNCLCSLAGPFGLQWTCHVESENAGGFRIYVGRWDQSTNWTTVPVRWIAIGP